MVMHFLDVVPDVVLVLSRCRKSDAPVRLRSSELLLYTCQPCTWKPKPLVIVRSTGICANVCTQLEVLIHSGFSGERVPKPAAARASCTLQPLWKSMSMWKLLLVFCIILFDAKYTMEVWGRCH